MKKNFRRIVSLLLALVMAMSLAVSASAAELRMNSLAAYGEKDIVITSESITEEAQPTEVVPNGDLRTYTCTAPVTVVNTYVPTAERPYSLFGVFPLYYDSAYGKYFTFDDDDFLGDGFTCTITEPGVYAVSYIAESANVGDIIVLRVVSNEAASVAPGLLNFKKVNSYRAGMYNDMYTQHTFTENVQTGYELGIMQGYGNRFGINDNITRLATIIIACRINCIYTYGSNNIDATYSGTTQERYLAYAKDHGILCDFGDVSKNATRAEFAAILSSAFPDEALPAMNTVVDDAIPDVTMDMNYAKEIYRLYCAGILNGSDAQGTFYPSSYITRGAACAIATRMCDVSLRKSVSLTVGRTDRLKISANEILNKMGNGSNYMAESIKNMFAVMDTGATAAYMKSCYDYWTKGVQYYKDILTLCGSYPEFAEVKKMTTEIVSILQEVEKSGYTYKKRGFWYVAYDAYMACADLRYEAAAYMDIVWAEITK